MLSIGAPSLYCFMQLLIMVAMAGIFSPEKKPQPKITRITLGLRCSFLKDFEEKPLRTFIILLSKLHPKRLWCGFSYNYETDVIHAECTKE